MEYKNLQNYISQINWHDPRTRAAVVRRYLAAASRVLARHSIPWLGKLLSVVGGPYLALRLWMLWLRRARMLTATEQAHATRLLDSVNAGEEEEEDTGADQGPGTPWRVRLGHGMGFLAAVVNSAQNEFGCPTRSEANMLVVRKYVKDLMVARGMRPTHIARHIDLVVSLVFVPNDRQIQARRYFASEAWKRSREEYDYETPREVSWWRWVFPLPEGLGGRRRWAAPANAD